MGHKRGHEPVLLLLCDEQLFPLALVTLLVNDFGYFNVTVYRLMKMSIAGEDYYGLAESNHDHETLNKHLALPLT